MNLPEQPLQPRLILASASPRRREMLDRLGLDFTVQPADIDESAQAGEAPRDYVLRLAVDKARAVATARTQPPTTVEASRQQLVLAADTIVAVDGDLLGKPRDSSDARRMLRRLADREHEVLTGVAVHDLAADRCHADVEMTRVRFADLSDPEIDWYVATGEPLDKAGAYAVQGLGALFVEGLAGNYSNVVGLPLPLTYRLLGAAGLPLLATLNPRI